MCCRRLTNSAAYLRHLDAPATVSVKLPVLLSGVATLAPQRGRSGVWITDAVVPACLARSAGPVATSTTRRSPTRRDGPLFLSSRARRTPNAPLFATPALPRGDDVPRARSPFTRRAQKMQTGDRDPLRKHTAHSLSCAQCYTTLRHVSRTVLLDCSPSLDSKQTIV